MQLLTTSAVSNWDADAILQLGNLYAENNRGSVPKYKLPKVLQVARVARIPPWPYLETD